MRIGECFCLRLAKSTKMKKGYFVSIECRCCEKPKSYIGEFEGLLNALVFLQAKGDETGMEIIFCENSRDDILRSKEQRIKEFINIFNMDIEGG